MKKTLILNILVFLMFVCAANAQEKAAAKNDALALEKADAEEAVVALKVIAFSLERFYLINDGYSSSFAVLDIDLNGQNLKDGRLLLNGFIYEIRPKGKDCFVFAEKQKKDKTPYTLKINTREQKATCEAAAGYCEKLGLPVAASQNEKKPEKAENAKSDNNNSKQRPSAEDVQLKSWHKNTRTPAAQTQN